MMVHEAPTFAEPTKGGVHVSNRYPSHAREDGVVRKFGSSRSAEYRREKSVPTIVRVDRITDLSSVEPFGAELTGSSFS